jgi:hypothetical protein
VDHALLAMLAKRPEERPTSVGSAIAAFEDPGPADTLPAPTVRSVRAIEPPVKRAPPWPALVLVAAAAGLVGFSIVGHGTKPAEPPDLAALRRRPVEPQVQQPPQAPRTASAAAPPNQHWVRLSLRSSPNGAEILGREGNMLGRTPAVLDWPRSATEMQLVLRLSGFEDAALSVVPDQDRALDTTLLRPRKTNQRPPTPAKGADDLEEFEH